VRERAVPGAEAVVPGDGVALGQQVEDQPDYNVFLSHAVQDIALVRAIASALPDEGLRGFVATYQIAPGREWLPRLESELRDCDALVAVLSPAFRSSPWTDQEVGFALACGRKVVPLQTLVDGPPHGFLQRFQGLPVTGLSGRMIAARIFDLLYGYPDEQPRLADIVIARLEAERNQPRINVWVRRLDLLDHLDDGRLQRLEHALATNAVIRNNTRAAARIRAAMDRCSR
jgi:hypothetical protein